MSKRYPRIPPVINLALIAMFAFGFVAKAQLNDKIFVDQEWLSTNKDSPDLRIIHVDSPEGYNQGHIPGSIFVSRWDFSVTSEDSLYTELPGAEKFADFLMKAGIDATTTVVISSGWHSFAWAYRLFFTFQYYGMQEKVRILDGGIKGWSSRQLAIIMDSVSIAPSTTRLTLTENPDLLVSKDWVRENHATPGIVVIDARKPDFYSGERQGNYLRSGHIKGGKNLTWLDLVDENHFLINKQDIRALYQQIGMNESSTLISYCHVGLRATVVYTIGQSLGYNARLYDGSFNEWHRLSDAYPVENGKN